MVNRPYFVLGAVFALACDSAASEASSLAGGGKADNAENADHGQGPDPNLLVFDAECERGQTLTIAAVGDVLLHSPLQRQAYAHEDSHMSLWNGVADLLAAADITYGNLEGPTAAGVDKFGRDVPDPGKVFDDVVYSSYPQFNYHPSLVDDLLATGFDVVSTSNNHSLDRRSLGADRTIDTLQAAGLQFTGTRKSDQSGEWHTVTEANGFRIAWLGCTFSTNGIPDTDDQVLMCYEDRQEVLALISDLAGDPALDAVITTPHWGVEYVHEPRAQEVDLAHEMIDAGATAVLGGHPHVLQPWERYETPDGREGFIIYSLGNFVSNQSQLPRRSTLLLYLGLKRLRSGVVVPYAARYVPLHLDRTTGLRELEAIDRVGGPEDSRALTVSLFGPSGLVPPVPEPELTPNCD